jgi:hypothetical protein
MSGTKLLSMCSPACPSVTIMSARGSEGVHHGRATANESLFPRCAGCRGAGGIGLRLPRPVHSSSASSSASIRPYVVPFPFQTRRRACSTTTLVPLHPGVFEIGIPLASGGHFIDFTDQSTILVYLPSFGLPVALNANVTDPDTTSSGFLGGDVAALKLDIDFSDAGLIAHPAGIAFGDLRLAGLGGGLTGLDGLTVRQILDIANVVAELSLSRCRLRRPALPNRRFVQWRICQRICHRPSGTSGGVRAGAFDRAADADFVGRVGRIRQAATAHWLSAERGFEAASLTSQSRTACDVEDAGMNLPSLLRTTRRTHRRGWCSPLSRTFGMRIWLPDLDSNQGHTD